MLLEEYAPTIKYIKGPDNNTADDLNKNLPINSDSTESGITRETLAEIYCVDKLEGDTFPQTHRMIYKYQQKKNR